MKKALCVIIVFVLLVAAAYGGYAIGANSKDSPVLQETMPPEDTVPETTVEILPEALLPSSPERLLKISARVVSDSVTILQVDALNGSMDQPLMYYGLKDVTIQIGEKSKKLEDAFADRSITLAQIFAYARADAENGFCEVSIRSKNGLSSFLYSYPEYDLKLIYDVYETPDGENHLISDMALYKPGGEIPRIYLNESDKILDLEDWGISLEVVETSADGITLSCTQSVGQQIGTLSAYAFRLIQDGKYMSALDGDTTTSYEIPETALSANSSTEFTIDWKDIYGTLSPGEYVIRVIVKDIYDKSQVHPLMRNFYDIQHYEITFTIS